MARGPGEVPRKGTVMLATLTLDLAFIGAENVVLVKKKNKNRCQEVTEVAHESSCQAVFLRNIYKIKEQCGITFCLSVHRSSVFSPMEAVLFSRCLSSLCFVVVVVSCLESRNHVSFFVARARQHFLKFILISMFNNPALLGSWQHALERLDAGNMFHTKVQTHKFLPVYLFPKASLQRHELKTSFLLLQGFCPC